METNGGEFGEAYWTADSTYSQFDGYQAGLDATKRWYQGLWRYVARHFPEPCKAIDVGCGYGAITVELHSSGFDVTGLDTSEWMVTQATSANPTGAPRFLVGDAAHLPEVGYGLITCIEVLEHLTDPTEALREFKRCLAPGGKLIATTPNLKPGIPWFDPVKADPTHVSVREDDWWRQELTAAGFQNVMVSTYLAIPLLWKVTPALARWIPMGRHAGPGVLIVAS